MALEMMPKLVADVSLHGNVITVANATQSLAFEAEEPRSLDQVAQALRSLDGTRTVRELVSDKDVAPVYRVMQALESRGLLEDGRPPKVISAVEALLFLEDVANDLQYKKIYANVFWRSLQDPAVQVPHNVLYGFAIENYHFLFRESLFDSPILGYLSSTPARLLMNEFYEEEMGHDELILKGINHIGITKEQLARTVPLPQTLALCTALSHWAASDPLFFFSTMGILEGKDQTQDSYITACERHALDEAFIKPLRDHSNINVQGEHGALTRKLFRHLGAVDAATLRRLEAKTHVFIDLYNQFFEAVWHHYSRATELLRLVD